MEKSINLLGIFKKLKDIEQTMATKQELNQAIETISILSNENTMRQIINSEKDITNGDFKEINSIDDI